MTRKVGELGGDVGIRAGKKRPEDREGDPILHLLGTRGSQAMTFSRSGMGLL